MVKKLLSGAADVYSDERELPPHVMQTDVSSPLSEYPACKSILMQFN
jgi:hypothetical protein